MLQIFNVTKILHRLNMSPKQSTMRQTTLDSFITITKQKKQECKFGICKGNGYFQDVDEGQDIGCLCSYRTLKNATYLDYPAEKYDISNEQVDKWNQTLRAHGIQCLRCDYVPQPREMNERTTYECSYCGSISGCP